MNLAVNHEIDVVPLWDQAGMTASTLCVAHCIASPFLAALLPIIAATEGTTHGLLALAVLSFGLLAFIPGFRRHRRNRVVALGASGVFLIWSPVLVPESLLYENIETMLTIAGGGLMVVAHIVNVYYCRRCARCAPQPCC